MLRVQARAAGPSASCKSGRAALVIIAYTLIVRICRWFFGQIKRVDAEKLLMMEINEVGSHLVRESESVPGTNG